MLFKKLAKFRKGDFSAANVDLLSEQILLSAFFEAFSAFLFLLDFFFSGVFFDFLPDSREP